ncbi:GspE family T2SS ATPase variant LspE [Legionella pneumophila serogroup 1]|uniref:Type II secretion system protein E n=1 Tax=Legionella pneumophila TaxID=446 RepID=I7I3L4_LEGPN|nr:GspE family T2SS ATPase variant LspE [Legionella pneumophila]ABQ54712.1 type II protein secretion ATPase LspE [Legionella pneumophila str. Corby]ADG24645.1 type II protein secretion ATPase LspE [Legionella pneumophila 2300/99 Alcoy]MCW8402200.1 GspE family T2SS ATPase variant LspE [Legionella pneumophila]MCW8434180.1 GspE family T2SS ATPase variant LspE [Legionella pneumophila]MCW8457204.1 GspE family T2SS ATPase variant LspE [Legionella pneumophila]
MENEEKSLKIPYSFAKSNGIVVGEIQENLAIVYHLPSTPLQAFAEIKRLLQCELDLKQVDESTFQQHLANIYQSKSSILDAAEGMEEDMDLSMLASQLPVSEDLLENQDDAPIIRLLNALFTQAIKQKASDIHIETYEDRVLVRNRIDGVLQEVLEIQRAIAPLVISRVKVMAKLDIAEKRIPQDGRISLRIGGHNIDVRVSTLPSNHGERVVLRILDKQAAQLDLNLLGMPEHTLKTVRQMIAEPHGIILVTGPTGSGKTTSLYAMLTELNQVTRNILTIEDPIEYDLPGVGQTQVNTKVQMTFAKGLRAILRQDPDVVMIGEIRDLETAEIAVQASLTGHLVLSTLHTNTALGALTRLHDMGVESFLLSSSIVGLIAQRLVRKLCSHCKTPHELRHEEKELMGLKPDADVSQVFEPKGCDYCNHLGYKGRTGIYELIIVDETLRGMIHRNENIQTMENYLRPTTPSIREDGFKRVLCGDTSLAEILRVTSQN